MTSGHPIPPSHGRHNMTNERIVTNIKPMTNTNSMTMTVTKTTTMNRTSAATKSKKRQLLCQVTQSPVTTGSSVLAMKYEVIQLSSYFKT